MIFRKILVNSSKPYKFKLAHCFLTLVEFLESKSYVSYLEVDEKGSRAKF